jgi:cell division septal protein FtsQ
VTDRRRADSDGFDSEPFGVPGRSVEPSADVLKELAAAFAADTDDDPPTTDDDAQRVAPAADLADLTWDDPRIDELLGIASAPSVVTVESAAEQPAPSATAPRAPTAQRIIVIDDESSIPAVVDVAAPAMSRRQRRRAEKAARNLRAGHLPRSSADAPVSAAAAPGPVGASAAGRSTIRIGGDDDLPDAVYLGQRDDDRLREVHGGEISRSGGSAPSADRATIVVADDGELDAVDVSAVRVPRSIDPRMRARRAAVGRSKGRRRLVIALVVVGVLALLVGAFGVVASSMFGVEEVSVQGATYTDPDELAALIDDINGEPILLLDTASLERRLESSPWVERARVTTDFPHRVVVDIRERRPLVTYRGADGRWRVTDRDGRVLALLDGQPIDYMQVLGDGPDAEPGQFVGANYANVAQLVIALPPQIRSITTAVTVDLTSGALGLTIEGGTVVRLGSAVDLAAKLARLLQVVTDGLTDVAEIDISTGEVSITPR